MSKERFLKSRFYRGLAEERKSIVEIVMDKAMRVDIERGKFNTLLRLTSPKGKVKFLCV